jgi:hypothetical protein
MLQHVRYFRLHTVFPKNDICYTQHSDLPPKSLRRPRVLPPPHFEGGYFFVLRYFFDCRNDLIENVNNRT